MAVLPLSWTIAALVISTPLNSLNSAKNTTQRRQQSNNSQLIIDKKTTLKTK
jgi:hypothetical protein